MSALRHTAKMIKVSQEEPWGRSDSYSNTWQWQQAKPVSGVLS